MKPRLGQRTMIARVANALARSGYEGNGESPICVVEAGTGTGKTIAYAVAAIPIAQALNKTLVISTATVALQEQLVYRDLPDLAESGALAFSFALAKGRGRYACPARMDTLLRQTDSAVGAQPALLEELTVQLDTDTRKAISGFYNALLDGEWQGDRDSWHDAIADQQWQMVTTDHHQCSGRRCAYVAECPFFRARDGLDSVDCIVANHDLVLADLSLGGGAVLPPPEETIYIFDEAHHLPDKACNHSSAHARLGLAREHLQQCNKLCSQLLATPGANDTLALRLRPVPALCEQADLAVAEIGAVLTALMGKVSATETAIEYRLPHGSVPDETLTAAADLEHNHSQLLDALRGAEEELSKQLEKGGPIAQEAYAALGLTTGRIERLARLWRAWSAPDTPGAAPTARWLKIAGHAQVEDLEVNAAPVLAATLLRESIWERAAGAVLTSATLTALGRFDRLLLRSGVPDDAVFDRVSSPFDYQGRAVLAIPNLVDPSQPEAHTQAIIEWMEAEVDRSEATLVLFASRRQMRDCYDRVALALRDRILMQDHYSKQALLHLHRDRIDQGEGSVIFGLASFAEGIDLPGQYCQHVVIAKIPFAVPDDPIEAALAEWVESRGGNAFMEISVPDAAVRLVQASGRLLRSENDSGRISLLDRRIVTRAYGRQILDSLPPFRREIH
jgi:ATP-dependent DNA helicase DinG